MFDYILFDFDGTVFDTVEGITKSVQYALKKHGINAQLNELRVFAGPPLADMFAEKYGFSHEESVELVRDFRERYLPVGLYECRVFPGVRELLCALRSAGKKTGIATSKPQNLAVELLDRAGLREYFDVISGAGDDGSDCEKRQVCKRAMELLNADTDAAILVGDRKYDVIGAHQCGIPCIGVRYGYAPPGELEAAGAEYIADTTQDVYEIIVGAGE